MDVREELLTGYDDFGNLIFLPAAAAASRASLLGAMSTCPLCGFAIDAEGRHQAGHSDYDGTAARTPRDGILEGSSEEA